MKAPSPNIMNKVARSVLALYSYDNNPDDLSIENVLRQSIKLIAQIPTIMSYAYQVKRRAYDHKSMYIHQNDKALSTAESILHTIRSDRKFTDEEAKILDLCMIIHADHGGGNNSTFTTRCITSTGTDTYSAIAAGIGSLKGPKHGGANIQVHNMIADLKNTSATQQTRARWRTISPRSFIKRRATEQALSTVWATRYTLFQTRAPYS